MHRLLDRVHELVRQTGVRLHPLRQCRAATTIPVHHVGLHLAAGSHVLQLIPVRKRSRATHDAADRATNQHAQRTRQSTRTGTNRRTADRATHRGNRVPGVAKILLLLLNLAVVPLHTLSLLRVRLHLRTLLIDRHTARLLLCRQHQRRQDLVSRVLPVLIVQVPALDATLKDVARTNHLLLTLIVLPALVHHRDARTPIQKVRVGRSIRHRLLVPGHELPVERRVPAVRRATKVPARPELRVVDRLREVKVPRGPGVPAASAASTARELTPLRRTSRQRLAKIELRHGHLSRERVAHIITRRGPLRSPLSRSRSSHPYTCMGHDRATERRPPETCHQCVARVRSDHLDRLYGCYTGS